MAQINHHSVKAYRNKSFLNSRDARALRILSEYLEPESRLGHYRVYGFGPHCLPRTGAGEVGGG